MARGILYVESRPSSPEREAEYHTWYEQHVRELLTIEGIQAARRYAPIDEDGPFVAIYEIDADDIPGVRDRMEEAFRDGHLTMSSALQSDPRPTWKLFEQIYEQR